MILAINWTILSNIIVSCIHRENSGGSNGIRTHALCDAGAMLYQLSYEATQLGAGQFVGIRCSRERTQWKSCLNCPDQRGDHFSLSSIVRTSFKYLHFFQPTHCSWRVGGRGQRIVNRHEMMWYVRNTNPLPLPFFSYFTSFMAVFKWLSKVITGLQLLRFVIGLKISH